MALSRAKHRLIVVGNADCFQMDKVWLWHHGDNPQDQTRKYSHGFSCTVHADVGALSCSNNSVLSVVFFIVFLLASISGISGTHIPLYPLRCVCVCACLCLVVYRRLSHKLCLDIYICVYTYTSSYSCRWFACVSRPLDLYRTWVWHTDIY